MLETHTELMMKYRFAVNFGTPSIFIHMSFFTGRNCFTLGGRVIAAGVKQKKEDAGGKFCGVVLEEDTPKEHLNNPPLYTITLAY